MSCLRAYMRPVLATKTAEVSVLDLPLRGDLPFVGVFRQ